MVFVARNIFLRDKLTQLLNDHPQISAVGCESPAFGEQYSEGMYGLFVFVNEALYTMRKDVVYFDPLRVKLLAKMDPSIRKGAMDKADMIAASQADTGIRKWDHNEADAYIIARSAARFWRLSRGFITAADLTPSESKVFLALNKCGTPTGGNALLAKEGDRFYRWSEL